MTDGSHGRVRALVGGSRIPVCAGTVPVLVLVLLFCTSTRTSTHTVRLVNSIVTLWIDDVSASTLTSRTVHDPAV